MGNAKRSNELLVSGSQQYRREIRAVENLRCSEVAERRRDPVFSLFDKVLKNRRSIIAKCRDQSGGLTELANSLKTRKHQRLEIHAPSTQCLGEPLPKLSKIEKGAGPREPKLGRVAIHSSTERWPSPNSSMRPFEHSDRVNFDRRSTTQACRWIFRCEGRRLQNLTLRHIETSMLERRTSFVLPSQVQDFSEIGLYIDEIRLCSRRNVFCGAISLACGADGVNAPKSGGVEPVSISKGPQALPRQRCLRRRAEMTSEMARRHIHVAAANERCSVTLVVGRAALPFRGLPGSCHIPPTAR